MPGSTSQMGALIIPGRKSSSKIVGCGARIMNSRSEWRMINNAKIVWPGGWVSELFGNWITVVGVVIYISYSVVIIVKCYQIPLKSRIPKQAILLTSFPMHRHCRWVTSFAASKLCRPFPFHALFHGRVFRSRSRCLRWCCFQSLSITEASVIDPIATRCLLAQLHWPGNISTLFCEGGKPRSHLLY